MDQQMNEIRVMLARIDERMESMLTGHKVHNRVLFGERGDNGISGRVSALEHAERRRDWTIKALLGAVLTTMAGVLTNWFAGK